MRLLVSVSSAAEAAAAVDGGADIVDAKDPQAGALGAVAIRVLHEIRDTVAGRRPLTAAIGDAIAADDAERRAAQFADAGAELLKMAFVPADAAVLSTMLTRAVRGAGSCGVVAVSYADRPPAAGVSAERLIEMAAGAGARGVLLDTADKKGPGLRHLITPHALARWVATAQQHGLSAAVAGQLTAGDLAMVAAAGAEIAGVRGAACDGGRTGLVSQVRVQTLVAALSELAVARPA
jgi:uncharacterized protein (UPF0264 family)